MKSITKIVFALIATFSLGVSAVEMKEGEHYEVISQVKSADKKVSEFFNYGCPGCYRSEALAKEIKSKLPKNAKFEAVPFKNHEGWKVYVEAFYVADMLKMSDKVHDKLYHRIHVERKPIVGHDELKKFFVELGANPKRFDKAIKSSKLVKLMANGRQRAISSRVMSTPTFIVNGAYKINAKAFSSTAELADGIVQLLAK